MCKNSAKAKKILKKMVVGLKNLHKRKKSSNFVGFIV